MSTDLVRYGGPSTAIVTASLPERLEYATALAQAGLLPEAYRRNPANVLLAIEKGEALGIHHMMAIESIHVIKGKTSQSAELMKALILRAGHMFDVVEQTPEKAVVECARRERPEKVFRHEWTIAEAHTAELTSNDNWRKYPKAMLAARATSEAARAHFSDVLAGMVYTPEELGAEVDGGGRIIDVTGTATVADHRTGEIRQDDAADRWLAEVEAAPNVEALRELWPRAVAACNAGEISRRVLDEIHLRSVKRGEQTGDDPPGAATARVLISQDQSKRMHVLLTRHGVTVRDDKLDLLSRLVGRPLDSSADLSATEAGAVIAELAKVDDFGPWFAALVQRTEPAEASA